MQAPGMWRAPDLKKVPNGKISLDPWNVVGFIEMFFI